MKYILFFALICFLACGNRSTQPTPVQAPPLPTSLPADFNAFYEQFHTDSTFQMAHIQWPLPGITSNDSLRQPSFRFEPQDWSIHRRFDPETSGYRSEFTPLSQDMIIERISDTQGRYGLERRWLRNSTTEEWELIYYQEPMPLGN